MQKTDSSRVLYYITRNRSNLGWINQKAIFLSILNHKEIHLNMNPACSVSLCEWTAQTRGFVYYTYLCVLSAISLYEDINTWMYLLSCSESHFRSILRKTILISHTHRIWRSSRQPVKINVRFGLKRLWQNVHLNVVTIIIITIFIPCFIFYSMFD